MALVDVKNLTFFYPGQSLHALQGLDLSVERGELALICGPSGCGKSTLLRLLKPALAPNGSRSGEIFFDGRPIDALDPREQSALIGFVSQHPEEQIVTDKVWHELAFGLESLGFSTQEIRRRTAETASFFGIQGWYHKSTAQLSGGEKQLLNLASVMVTGPRLLLLDEPTSRLDPIAASDFIAALGRAVRDLGVTVIMTEHRPEEAIAIADTLSIMERGSVIFRGPPREAAAELRERGSAMLLAMPAPARIWALADGKGDCPVTVREGRDWLSRFAGSHALLPLPETEPIPAGEEAVSCHEVFFRYGRDLPDVVRGLDLTLRRGELLAVVGGNGTGKTTALELMAGLNKPYRGEIRVNGSLALLPQEPKTLFVKKTLGEDIAELLPSSDPERGERTARAVRLCRLEGLLDRHPYDLSGGERQRAALAKLLILKPDILLLDEPTKGLDAGFKRELAGILRSLTKNGAGVIMVSHDMDFCAKYADRCALFFDGSVVAEGTPRDFFSGGGLYTTQACRMSRGLIPGAVTAEDVMLACGAVIPPEPEPDNIPQPPIEPEVKAPEPAKKPPPWRKLAASLAGALAALSFIAAARAADSGAGRGGERQLFLGIIFILAMTALALSTGRRGTGPTAFKKRPPPGRISPAIPLTLLLIPLTLYAGMRFFGGRRYYFVSLLVLLEITLPFFLNFEGRRPKARELAVTAALCALGVAGRWAFFMFQQVKPVMAIVIISGAALGGETGFLVGAVTMLVSNMIFSQGPWTPWQMFAMGTVGLLAGALFNRGPLRPSRAALCAFGALSAVVIYGGIMNLSSALIWARDLDLRVIMTYYITGFPLDCVHAAGTALFLWLGAEPLLEKLERIKVKYLSGKG